MISNGQTTLMCGVVGWMLAAALQGCGNSTQELSEPLVPQNDEKERPVPSPAPSPDPTFVTKFRILYSTFDCKQDSMWLESDMTVRHVKQRFHKNLGCDPTHLYTCDDYNCDTTKCANQLELKNDDTTVQDIGLDSPSHPMLVAKCSSR